MYGSLTTVAEFAEQQAGLTDDIVELFLEPAGGLRSNLEVTTH
jgi:hypothetical protein